MASNRFHLSLILHCALLFASLFLAFFFYYTRQQPTTAAGMILLSLIVLLRLIYLVNRTNRILANFLVYMQEKDPSLSYTVKYTDASGIADIYVNSASIGTMDIHVWAQNHNTYSGTIDVTGVGITEREGGTVCTNSLNPVSPSPALSTAVVSFSLSEAGAARVDVFDISGRIVATLASEELTSGSHSLLWNLEDSAGRAVPSGLYQIRVSSGSFTASTGLIVIR